MYEDRATAGTILGQQFVGRGVRPDVVLAVPPGGINVARPVADRFDAELGLLAAEPVRTPSTRHGPIGAVTDTGVAWVDDDLVAAFGVDREELDEEKQRAFRDARHKHDVYADAVDDPAPTGTVAVVDDGIFSTVELKASLSAIGQLDDSRAVVATPVGVPGDVAELHAFADEVVVDETTPESGIRNQFYDSFDRMVFPGRHSSD